MTRLKKERLILIFIVTLAFFLRFFGISFGLPHLYHADEPIVVNHTIAYGSGDLNPHFFKIPPLVSYLLFILYGIYFVIGKLVGQFSTLDDFVYLFLTDPSSFYFVGRLFFGAIGGTLTVYILYRLVKRYSSIEHALISSFFLAVAFLHVRDSHYIYADIPLVLILCLCFFPIFHILESGGRRYYVLFSFLAGIAVATKYNGVFVFVPFLTAHFFRTGFKWRAVADPNLVLTFVLSFLAYSVLNPFGWVDFQFFLQEITKQSHAEGFSGLLHHLTYSLNGGLGFPLLGLSLFGLSLACLRFDRKRWTLLSFILVYYLILCFFSQPYDRYTLPLIPFLVIFAADGLLQLKRKLKLSNIPFFIVVLIAIFPSVLKISLSDYIFMQKDIRTVGREWIERTVPQNTKIALDMQFYLPQLKPNLAQLIQKKEAVLTAPNFNKAQLKRVEVLIQEAERSGNIRYELFFLKESQAEEKFLFSKPMVPYDLDYLKNKGVEYVIISQISPGRASDFCKDLDQKAQLVAKFTPYRDKLREWPIDRQPLTGGVFLWSELIARERNGQIFKVYRLN